MTRTAAAQPLPQPDITALPMARVYFTARAEEPFHLPDYAGSMLRGAFGHALKTLTLLPHDGDKPCALQDTCPYCRIFAPPPLRGHALQKFSHMPAHYVIEPPGMGARRLDKGETFAFT